MVEWGPDHAKYLIICKKISKNSRIFVFKYTVLGAK